MEGGVTWHAPGLSPTEGSPSAWRPPWSCWPSLYAAFVVALLWAGMPWWLVLLVVGGVALVQYFASDRIAMAALGAREVTPQQDPELHAVVDRLCALADMPKPKVAVAHTDVPNAFATGHSRGSTMVCVTTGLRRRLDNVELEAVLAHELSHVAHRDVAVMTVAAFLGIVAGFLVQLGPGSRSSPAAGRSRGRRACARGHRAARGRDQRDRVGR